MEEKGLKLYATRCSGYCIMVEMALRLKGLKYEYVEEDLSGKSAALLRYNPVHKKVPVLVHDGQPVAESLVILHYIDETWSHPPLLPSSPIRRAQVRFWVDFFFRELMPASTKVLITQGEELAGALEELREKVKKMEEGLRRDFSGEGRFFGGAAPGLLDVVFAPSCVGVAVTEELLGVDLVGQESAPFWTSRMAAIAELSATKEVLPPREVYLAYAKATRERFLPAARP